MKETTVKTKIEKINISNLEIVSNKIGYLMYQIKTKIKNIIANKNPPEVGTVLCEINFDRFSGLSLIFNKLENLIYKDINKKDVKNEKAKVYIKKLLSIYL